MNLTFRNTTTYRPDGSFIPEGYIFTVSSYGKQNWTNNLRLNSLVVSTFTLNSTFIVASTNTNNMVIFSSLTVSSTDSRNLTYSTLIGDTILTNSLTLNSNLNVGSTFASLHQASTFAGSSIRVHGVTASTANVLLANLSTLSTGTHTTQTLTVTSTLTGSTMTMDGASVSTIGVSSLVGGAVQVTGLLTTSSLAVPGQTVFSTMLGSTVTAHALTLQSTLLGSSIQCVNLLSERATVNALTIPSTAVVSTAILNLATVSSFRASTLTTGLTLFSTLIGAAITASTLTLNTIVVNSTLITSTFATGSLNFSTLVGSSIVNNILAVTSTATISTTTTSTLVVNRVPTTEVDPPYKMVVEQGSGQNENAFYIGNSNGGSAQGLSIGMVNEGFSFFASYAKIQGKRSGSAGTTNLILQPDTGKVGIGTTNPDAVLDVYAPTGTPATLFVYNGASGTNSTGTDVTVAAFNMGSSGSGLYFDSIRIRVPNGATTSAARMDFCTPAAVSDNAQATRLSIAPYTGYIGIGTTGPTNLLHIHSGTTNLVALRLTSGSAGWGNGMVFENTTAMTGRTYGIYTDSLMGSFRVTDVTASTDRLVIDSTGNVGVGTMAPVTSLHVYQPSSNPIIGLQHGTNSIFGIQSVNNDRIRIGSYSSGNINDYFVVKSNGNVGVATSNPLNTLHLHGSMLQTNPTIYNTNVAGWYNIGLWDCTANQNSGARLKLRLMGCNGYNGVSSGTQSGGETIIYLTNLNNMGSVSQVNVDGIWHHTGGVVPLATVKVVQNGASRFQYYIYALVQSYTQHSINIETTQGTAFTPSFTSVSDPGVNSATVQLLPVGTITNGQNVGIGTTNPAYKLHVHGNESFVIHQIKNDSAAGYSGIYLGTDQASVGVIFKNGTTRSADGGVNTMTVRNDGGDLQLQGTGGAGMIVKGTSGNVGIGTASPSTLFHLAKSVTADADYSLMTFYQNTASGYFDWAMGPQIISANAVFSIRGGADGAISSMSNFFNVSGATGNVGIGTTNPSYRLHVTNGNASKALFGPNTSWGASLLVGAGDNELTTTTRAQIIATDGNLHVDAARSKVLYLGYYANEAGFPNTVYSYGPWTHYNNFTATGTLTGGSITTGGSLTGHEVYANSWFRVNGNGGLWFESYGRGIRSADAEGNTYGNVCTHGTGRNGWSGYGMTTRHTVMSNGDGVGIHDNNSSWCIYFDGSRNCTINGSLTLNGAFNIIPRGIITMWYGSVASIPSGWALCNGANGTPNLQDRFVIAAGSTYSPGNTGGENFISLQKTHLPPHEHYLNYSLSNSQTNHSHQQTVSVNPGAGGTEWMTLAAWGGGYGSYPQSGAYTVGATANINISFSASVSDRGPGWGDTQSALDNRPLYYALCYIMKI